MVNRKKLDAVAYQLIKMVKKKHKKEKIWHTEILYFTVIGTGTAYLSGAPEFTLGFNTVRVARSLVYCVMFCRSLLVPVLHCNICISYSHHNQSSSHIETTSPI